MRQLMTYFEGAPEPDEDFSRVIEFFAKHQVETFGYYCAYPELTVNQIRRDADWRKKVLDMQKSLARPATDVAMGQTVSGI